MAVNIGPKIGIDGESEYRKQINNIIQQTKTLKSEYEKVTSSMEKGKTTLKSNAEQHRILSERIKTQEQYIKEMSSMLDESSRKYGENDARTLKWSQAVNEATTKLNRMKEELRQLPNGLQVVGDKMQAVGDKIKGIGDKVSGIGTSLSTRLTLPLAAIGTKAVQSFAEVDKTMALTNKTMGNSETQVKLLGDAMKKAAVNSVFGMDEAATATLNFARAGLTAKEAAAALAPAMNLAAGEGGNLETVSAGLVATINGFGDSFEDTSHYADVFAAACNNSALNVDELSEAMSVAAPIFKTAGMQVDDAALYMGVMANAGIEASVAANSLKTGFARLVKPAKEGKKAMEEYGISIVNADGSIKDSVEIQKELHDAFKDMSEAEQIAAASAIFGKNQMSNWLALINTAPEDVRVLSDEIERSAGITNEMADAMMSGFGGSLEKLKASIDVAVNSLGEALAPTISSIAGYVQSAVDWFNSLDESEREQIAKIGLMVAAAGPLLVIGGKLTSGIGTLVTGGGQLVSMLGQLAPALSGVSSGAGAASGALAGIASPAGIAVAAVALLAGAFVTAYNEDEAFAAEVNTAWAEMTKSMTNLIETVKPAWKAFSETISPVFLAAVKGVKNGIDYIQQKFEGFVDIVGGIVDGDWKRVCQGISKTMSAESIKMEKDQEATSKAIKGIWEKLDIKLPHIKLPHFSVQSTDKFGLPKFKIDWYAKAMQGGMKLDKATIFGASNGRLLGGGEAGNEWIVGENSLMGMIRSAVGSSNRSVNIGETTIVINTQPGQDEIEIANMVDEIITNRMEQAAAVWA